MNSFIFLLLVSTCIPLVCCTDKPASELNMTAAAGESCFVTLEKEAARSCDRTKKFLVGVASVNWFKAKENCEKFGYKLASITSKEENDNAMKQLKLQGDDSPVAWIGANDLAREGSFVWTGNVKTPFSTYENWYTNEPNNNNDDEDCCSLYPDGSFNDWSCYRNLLYVCEYFNKC